MEVGIREPLGSTWWAWAEEMSADTTEVSVNPTGELRGQGFSFPFPRTWRDDFAFSPCKLFLEGAVPLGKQPSAVQHSFQMEMKRPH